MADIFEQVRSLNLPIGQYAVIGSGVMAAHGIRDHKDVDLLVTNELYENLKRKGWTEKEVKPGFKVVQLDLFEASPDMVTLRNYNPDTSALIKNAELINGIAFVSLQDVVDFKKALGREKDYSDIKLIEEYLKKC